jgi:hypothetical protein
MKDMKMEFIPNISCGHIWLNREGMPEQCVICGSECTRDARGKIETYSAGAGILEGAKVYM